MDRKNKKIFPLSPESFAVSSSQLDLYLSSMEDSAERKMRRPVETKFNQQKYPCFSPIYTPTRIVIIYMLVGLLFIIFGIISNALDSSAVDYKFQYDGNGMETTDCSITETNEAKECNLSFTISEDIAAPIYVMYELDDFYSNHRDYVASFTQDQLTGSTTADISSCYPLETIEDENLTLNPCGLIANTFFNDVITVTSGQEMQETGIAWDSDFDKFSQPSGFVSTECSDTDCAACLNDAFDLSASYDGCDFEYDDSGTQYAYWYPDDDSTQYLYETFPMNISPLDGVMNEHFIVWMRVAGLRKFRKPYGIINESLSKGDVVTFNIVNNFVVKSFEGKKSLVLSRLSSVGAENIFWAFSFITLGVLVILMAVLIAVIERISPRTIGSTKVLFDM